MPGAAGLAVAAQATGFSSTAAVGSVATKCEQEKYNLVLIPRKRTNLYAADNRLKTWLKSYPAQCADSPLRGLEYNFYPDLNAERTITAVLTEDPWSPHSDPVPARKNASIKFELVEGAAADFQLSSTSAATADGHAEIKLKVLKFHKEDTLGKHSHVKIRATVATYTAELDLTIHRNEDVGEDLAAVLNRDSLLVRQQKDYVTSQGAETLQKLLNQVVARHKAAANFKWLTLDAQYGASAGDDVKEFLTHFKGAFDYPKGHFNAHVDQDLIDYVKAEYGKYEDGCLVDRNLLIGKDKWAEGQPHTQVDGLLDIYNGVILRFFAEMKRNVQWYTSSFTTFWLHRPSEDPYQKGDDVDDQFVVTPAALNVRKAAGSGEAILETVKQGATLRAEGEEKTLPGNQVWRKVKTPAGTVGWCAGSRLQKVTNDRAKSDQNSGNYGVTGVAYSFGGKDRPDAFAARLNGNAVAPKDISTWAQYDLASAPKEGRPGDNTGPGNGCDCSGFTQNCLTESVFPDNTRIVPATLVPRLEPRPAQDWPWTTCIPAKDFVGSYSRGIPYHSNQEKKQWLDQADVIQSETHVVWVADRHPRIKHPTNDREFEVYNEFGGDDWFSEPHDNKFTRKAIRMKFKCWGIKLNQARIEMGRVYFWE